ncbi:MAG: AtpZ/AtpI family protein [Thermaerobacter sp.]|jgi:F0F1-type ATP synthase assembly protein I|nr:AtpZ/AtpI family protein [Thermaerobacter sp.]
MAEGGNRGMGIARGVGVAFTLSFQLAASVLLGYLLGQWLDSLLHTAPWLTVAGVLTGVVAGFVGLYHLSRVLLR